MRIALTYLLVLTVYFGYRVIGQTDLNENTNERVNEDINEDLNENGNVNDGVDFNKNLIPAIYKGTRAKPGQFPHQVSLEVRKRQGYPCAGSLIGENWVLTAASCVVNTSEVTVYLGNTYINFGKNFRTVGKSCIYQHPAYNDSTKDNDISLIYIPKVISTNEISPIKLPAIASSYPTYINKTGVIIGWGQTRFLEDSSAFLNYAKARVVDNSNCRFHINVYRNITDSHLCIAGESAACLGDDGGPMVLDSPHELVGVITKSSFNCLKNFPALATRVTSYLDWIKSISGI